MINHFSLVFTITFLIIAGVSGALISIALLIQNFKESSFDPDNHNLPNSSTNGIPILVFPLFRKIFYKLMLNRRNSVSKFKTLIFSLISAPFPILGLIISTNIDWFEINDLGRYLFFSMMLMGVPVHWRIEYSFNKAFYLSFLKTDDLLHSRKFFFCLKNGLISTINSIVWISLSLIIFILVVRFLQVFISLKEVHEFAPGFVMIIAFFWLFNGVGIFILSLFKFSELGAISALFSLFSLCFSASVLASIYFIILYTYTNKNIAVVKRIGWYISNFSPFLTTLIVSSIFIFLGMILLFLRSNLL